MSTPSRARQKPMSSLEALFTLAVLGYCGWPYLAPAASWVSGHAQRIAHIMTHPNPPVRLTLVIERARPE